ncbi:MAG TPA: SagB/ThcOx family dehydrogenase, partial [Candidatus Acidoferrales bacterium]|nr:SagB/ThcOx family dehydrogenase [Candidatus Acidoferrales bacterium]
MTRFLSRVWDDPDYGSFNTDTQRLFSYHQGTKHTYHSVRRNARYLDWRNQPDPFRRYEGVPEILLPRAPGFPDVGIFAAIAGLSDEKPGEKEGVAAHRDELSLDPQWISRMLWHSMAVSAWKLAPGGGARYSLRVNPSSGNLHPTEIHLAVRGFSGVHDGLYHYRADRHALELRSRGGWTRHLAQGLEIPWAAESPLIVGLTSIFWRESWKYGDRAYRYCCHDLGHALMSVLLAARALGLGGGAVAHFGDARMFRALGLEGSDEAPMAFLVFPARSAPPEAAAAVLQTPVGIPNELSEEEVRYELISGIYGAGCLPDPPGPLPRNPAAMPAAEARQASMSGPERDVPLAAVVRRRRSALDFDAGTLPMQRAELEQLLDFATRDWPGDWRGTFQGDAQPAEAGADLV